MKMTIFSKFQRFPYSFRFLSIFFVVNSIFCSFNHLVNIRTDEPLPVGERIYVLGHLSSKPFQLDDGRLRQKLVIKSKYIQFRGHELKSQATDENNVIILAKIVSEIQHTDKHILFTLASTHTPKYTGFFT